MGNSHPLWKKYPCSVPFELLYQYASSDGKYLSLTDEKGVKLKEKIYLYKKGRSIHMEFICDECCKIKINPNFFQSKNPFKFRLEESREHYYPLDLHIHLN